MSEESIVLATRGSPLALVQCELVRVFLGECFPGTDVSVLKLTTTGDQRKDWSLEEQGGDGLFTKELEVALLEGKADIAVHSAKDLPAVLESGLDVVGYLPRDSVHDILVRSHSVRKPKIIASGSPRRRAQARIRFPDAEWVDIRGNVSTRLEKISGGFADATILAAAGLKRLGIDSWPGLSFNPLDLEEMVPAAGQGAIAMEIRSNDRTRFENIGDSETGLAVRIEKLLLKKLGVGCHSAVGAHWIDGEFLVYHEKSGFKRYEVKDEGKEELEKAIDRIIGDLETV
ncbi:MAG: Porphobilinogen deaminase [Candidatus Moanabacter tarae]|uniref:Hydroxymethylbilane synthase n=1 Tax=Candidatus Moanibacter tarae TaxID=2200854 RepID=A0A2Z4AGZ2_9BACT|nr:MAG: Porphobilinogen deaminase [Candidatus Moanabacter tarae]|tara:strand:+ start:1872 stop:2732 length:861 start_codon:yes stop_codon:yes gene_type:complete